MAIPSVHSSDLKTRMEGVIGPLPSNAKVEQYAEETFGLIFKTSEIDWKFFAALLDNRDLQILTHQMEKRSIVYKKFDEGFVDTLPKQVFVVRFKDLKNRLVPIDEQTANTLFLTGSGSKDISVIEDAIKKLQALKAKPENLALKDKINVSIQSLENRKMSYEILRQNFITQKLAFLKMQSEGNLNIENLLEIRKALFALLDLAKKNLHPTQKEIELIEEMQSIYAEIEKNLPIDIQAGNEIFASAEFSNDTKQIQVAIDALKVIASIYDYTHTEGVSLREQISISCKIDLFISSLNKQLEKIKKTVDENLPTLCKPDPK